MAARSNMEVGVPSVVVALITTGSRVRPVVVTVKLKVTKPSIPRLIAALGYCGATWTISISLPELMPIVGVGGLTGGGGMVMPLPGPARRTSTVSGLARAGRAGLAGLAGGTGRGGASAIFGM